MNQIYSCIICNALCDNQQISLTTGHILHHACHDALKDKFAKCNELIANLNSRNLWLKERIRRANSMFYKLRRLMGGEAINISECHREIDKNNDTLEKLSKKKDDLNKTIELIYDYWPSYPPDWEERKESAREKIGFCERCHASRIMLHVHHKLPISRGGNHKLDNLIILCEKCHSLVHGGRGFDFENKNIESSFTKKIIILRSAIANEYMVRFSYTRRDGRESVRTVIPRKFENIESSLCIHGYCYLRQEARTFAIKRMQNLKHVVEPGECYYK
jgi:hypothetical protein